MWHDIGVAICLVLVIEGLLPFLSPASWRRTLLTAARLDDNTLRLIGLGAMLIGVVMLYLIN